jgi:hypothetical protein
MPLVNKARLRTLLAFRASYRYRISRMTHGSRGRSRLLAMVVLALLACSIAPAGAVAKTVTARIEFTGSYAYTDIVTNPFQPSSTSQTLRWDEVTVAEIAGARVTSSQTTLTLSGKLDVVTQSSGDEHCTYSAYAPLISSISPQAVATADGSGKLAEIIASAAIPDHVAAQVRQSGTATEGNGSPSAYCTTPSSRGADILLSDNFSPAPFQGVDGQKFAAAADLGATLPAGRVRVTAPGHASASALSSDEKASRSLTTSLTVETDRGAGSGGLPPPEALTLPHHTKEEKLAAAEDFRDALRSSVPFCLSAVAGAASLVLAAAAPPAAIQAGIAGLALAGAGGTVCSYQIDRMIDDAKIVADPPDPHVGRLVRPVVHVSRLAGVSCGGRTGSALTFCRAVNRDMQAMVDALARLAADTHALRVTLDRLSTAARQRNRGALNRQAAQARQLDRPLASARAAELRTARALAALIAGAGVSVGITTPNDAQGLSDVAAGLARRHLSAATLRLRGGTALTPAAVDVLANLRRYG